ncbi:MAG: preprotein translocase subunit YajC [Acidimicrobiales bacterium]|jgi:preprotein translocase subunit YajC
MALLLPVVVLVFMYFLMIRPQQRKMRARETMIRAIGQGDEIATVGGVLGTVIAFEGDDVVVIEVDTDTELRVQRRAVGEVVSSVGGDSDDDGADAADDAVADELEAEAHEGPVSDA